MIKKAVLLFLLCAFMVTFYGCESAGRVVKNTDEWIQKNLW